MSLRKCKHCHKRKKSPTTVNKKVFHKVVKIFAVKCYPDCSMPWNTSEPSQSQSTGFIISKQRIICTAHGVSHAQSLRVAKHGDPTKYNAIIKHICHDVDLAILEISDLDFWYDDSDDNSNGYHNDDNEYDNDCNDNDNDENNDDNGNVLESKTNANININTNTKKNNQEISENFEKTKEISDNLPKNLENSQNNKSNNSNNKNQVNNKKMNIQKPPKSHKNYLEFDATIPELQSTINILGFPKGGDNICVTKGVISRICIDEYSHSSLNNLVIQIDAALNGGASGGPAIMNNKVVGIGFQGRDDAQNIGYCIPVNVINWFLNGIILFNGNIPRTPTLGIDIQACENTAMQKKLGIIDYFHKMKKKKLHLENSIKIDKNKNNKNEKNDKNKNTETETNEKKQENDNNNNNDTTSNDKQITNTLDTTITSGNYEADSESDTENNDDGNDSSLTDISNVSDDSDMSESKKSTIETTKSHNNNSKKRGMNTKQGVYITEISPLSDSYNYLEIGDVLLSIDNIPIANDGTILFRSYSGERVHCVYLQCLKYITDTVIVKILRNGKEMIFNNIKLSAIDLLIPTHSWDVKHPSYYIFGGLVFIPLTIHFLMDKYGDDWDEDAPTHLLYHAYYKYNNKQFKEEEIIILAHILPNSINDGYNSCLDECCIVEYCNNIKIENLKHLTTIIDSSELNENNNENENESENDDKQFVTLRVTPKHVCIMDVKECREKLDDILQSQNIQYDRSINLRNDN